MTRTYLLIAALLAGCAAPAPPPEPVVYEDPVQAELDRRQAAKEQRARVRAQTRQSRARAVVLPDGVADMAAAPAADYRGRYAAMWTGVLGETHDGGLLVVLDSATTPDRGRGSVVVLPGTLSIALERGGTMGRLLQEEPVVLVDLVPAHGAVRHPSVLRLQVLDPIR